MMVGTKIRGKIIAITWLSIVVVVWFAQSSSADISIEMVQVGDPNNLCDPQTQGCFGRVEYEYQIGKTELRWGEYVEFLNAVAVTDEHGLYHPIMGGLEGGYNIVQNGSPGNYSYVFEPQGVSHFPENFPIFGFSFWDAARFCNWMHNGQPTGLQDSTTTEDGAYTLTASSMANNSVERNPGAKFFIPTEDEWYKAAYYDPNIMDYYDYPAGTDDPMIDSLPTSTPNRGNFGTPPNLYWVGLYTNSASPYGTFDQGGQLNEMNETVVDTTKRGVRGGHWWGGSPAAFFRYTLSPTTDGDWVVGFRIASPPPSPATPAPTSSTFSLVALSVLLVLIGGHRVRRGS